LKYVDLDGGSLDGAPSEIINSNCLKQLRAHFSDLDAGEERLPDVKVMILGNGRIGKTQLCGQLKGDLYDDTAESTHGIIVSSKDLGSDRLHIWDFGGQDLYHGTHALFMKTRAIFMILWNPDSENQIAHEWKGMSFRNHRLEYWMEFVARQSGLTSPVLIVQCRCDTPELELRFPPASSETLSRFSFCKILHHSSAVNRGLESIKEALTDAIQWIRQKHGTTKIGIGRLRVKQRLEALRDTDSKRSPDKRIHRLISLEFFKEICEEEKGISNPELLLSYLHETGVLFYQKGLFENRIILDQGWALEAIYTVFHREKCWRQIRLENGRFTRALLEAFAWQKYSIDEQKLFLSMMKSCGICFAHRKLDNEEYEYIAPELLPPEAELADVLAVRWNDKNPDHIYEYELSHEHPGLLIRIISTVGALAGIDALYWKGGFCGYEKNTHSSVRIRETSDHAKEKELRFSLETKGGNSLDLIKLISETLENTVLPPDCRRSGKMAENNTQSQIKQDRVSESLESGSGNETTPSLEFTEPPRSSIKYAVSYAWTDESSSLVDDLCTRAEQIGIQILRDKNTLGIGEELTRFMRHLAKQDRVFVILSKKYLESPYCMFELLEIWRLSKEDKNEFRRKVRCFALPDAEFSSPVHRMQRAIYWKSEFDELDALIKQHGVTLLGDEDISRYKRMQEFTNRVGDMLCAMADIVRPNSLDELQQYGFAGEPEIVQP
ncbi:MAG: TIR domain-containing protein, partial [Verrucomicrobiaceae bacterium]